MFRAPVRWTLLSSVPGQQDSLRLGSSPERRPTLRVVVFEAADRPGGRAHTGYRPKIGAPLDLGCGWFHGAGHNPWLLYGPGCSKPLRGIALGGKRNKLSALRLNRRCRQPVGPGSEFIRAKPFAPLSARMFHARYHHLESAAQETATDALARRSLRSSSQRCRCSLRRCATPCRRRI